MVKYQPDLGRTFAALADPTRRAMLAALAAEPGLAVSDLARPFPISLPAVMKHLDVLGDAGLVAREKTGRIVACRLRAAPMEEAVLWLTRYEKFWSEGLARLAHFVEEDECSTAPASRSAAASKRRPPKSSRRGRSRKK